MISKLDNARELLNEQLLDEYIEIAYKNKYSNINEFIKSVEDYSKETNDAHLKQIVEKIKQCVEILKTKYEKPLDFFGTSFSIRSVVLS